MRQWFRIPSGIAVASLMMSMAAPARADLESSKDVVKASATASKADKNGVRTVTVTLEIDKPYHLYANPVGNEFLEPSQTVLEFEKGDKIVKIDYPAGKPYEQMGTALLIYEGKVVIKAKVNPKKKDAPVSLTVRVNACTDTQCLLGDKIKLTAK